MLRQISMACVLVVCSLSVLGAQPKAPERGVLTGSAREEGWYKWERYRLMALDGTFIREPFFVAGVKAKAKVSPGLHRAVVSAQFERSYSSGGPFEAIIMVPFEAKEGVAYRISGQVSDNKIDVWIEDADSGTRVSEIASGEYRAGSKQNTVPVFIPAR
jgi:hypothetical protein